VPYLLQFQRVIGTGTTPPPEETLDEFIRRSTWDEVEIDYFPDAALTKYAAAHNLGKPETNEFDLEYEGTTYRVQAFTRGIASCVLNDWDNITHVGWLA